jgi:hypothetical protein
MTPGERKLALHGMGDHFESFASFLKFVLVIHWPLMFCGSSVTVVMTNQSPASALLKRV